MNAHWILSIDKTNCDTYGNGCFRCSNCKNFSYERFSFPTREHYCHACGAHMIEEPTIEIFDVSDLCSWEDFHG